MKKFLVNAQEYAYTHGDDDWFCEVYNNYRATMDIEDSTRFALYYLYGYDIANFIKETSSPAFI
jgi:hypothetical protein